jgi:hypothetical protein
VPKPRFLPAIGLAAPTTGAVIGLRPSLVGIGGVRYYDFALVQALKGRAQYHVWPGGHNSKYWDAHMPAYLRFYSRALAGCSTGSQ